MIPINRNKYFCDLCNKSLKFSDLAYCNLFLGKFYYYQFNNKIVCKCCYEENEKDFNKLDEFNKNISYKQTS
jgi:hypothetical protein